MNLDPSLHERADLYLDGSLSRLEALEFESDLARLPEVAEALTAALALRELLQLVPPLRPPEGLEDRIIAALPLRKTESARKSSRSFGSVRAALDGLSWSFRGPATVLGSAFGGALPVAAGVAQLRWSFGTLGSGHTEPAPKPPRTPLWRRALRLAGR